MALTIIARVHAGIGLERAVCLSAPLPVAPMLLTMLGSCRFGKHDAADDEAANAKSKISPTIAAVTIARIPVVPTAIELPTVLHAIK